MPFLVGNGSLGSITSAIITSSTSTTTSITGMAYYDTAWTSWAAASTAICSTTVWEVWAGSAEESAAFSRRAEAQVQAQTEAQRKRDEANKVAEALLLECLTSEQRAQYQRSKMFVVKGDKTGDTYEINCAYHSRNIRRHDGKRYCAHPPLDVPLPDIILAQKLAIEYNEEHFLEKANVG